ncbi:MAG: hypothetical protein FWD57_17145 [Polyangiaceae bacterium]|nr:hypothetical protein [Polyangiaceae bacterium]
MRFSLSVAVVAAVAALGLTLGIIACSSDSDDGPSGNTGGDAGAGGDGTGGDDQDSGTGGDGGDGGSPGTGAGPGDGGSGGGEPQPQDCVEIQSLTGAFASTQYLDQYGRVVMQVDITSPTFGGNDIDGLDFAIVDSEGTFQLGTGANATAQNCDQCVTMGIDYDESNQWKPAKEYFAASGSITVTRESDWEHVKVFLHEVTLREIDSNGAFVNNGECATVDKEIQFAPFN